MRNTVLIVLLMSLFATHRVWAEGGATHFGEGSEPKIHWSPSSARVAIFGHDSLRLISPIDKQNNWVWTRALPLGLLAYSLKSADVAAYSYREHFMPEAHTKIDDFSIFLPMTNWAFMLSGKTGTYSRNPWDLLLVQTSAVAISSIVTQGAKLSFRRLRPDGSVRNSFPSGHTSLSFVMATVFSEEYGDDYPFLSALGYTTASLTALCRVYNKRHWISDLGAGAFVGIASTKLAYALCALFQKRQNEYQPFPILEEPLTGYHFGFTRSIASIYRPKVMWENEAVSGPAQLIGMNMRLPFYKQWGVRFLGDFIMRERQDGSRLYGYSIFGGVTYQHAFSSLSPLLYGDASLSLGYLSQTRRSSAAAPNLRRSESVPTTAPGVALRPELALISRTGKHSNIRAYAAYIYSPTAQDYSRLSKDGIQGWELGLGVEWAW